ncbi:MAG TPA: matrixin family metalloprotease [Candidatus Nitrosotalea sp.]|nr:matrixin family metalloprotease [Candidatus Nitrosotalea sp.]
MLSSEENDPSNPVKPVETDKVKELEQEKIILKEVNDSISAKADELEKSKQDADDKLCAESKKSKELEQEKIILEGVLHDSEKRERLIHKKHYVSIAVIAVAVSVGFVEYSNYENQVLINAQIHVGNYNSPFTIQNLRGDVVNTYVSWNLVSGRILNVNIEDQAGLSPDQLLAVKNAILSTETITLDDSLLNKGPSGTSLVYYKGWQGALTYAATKSTSLYIPQKFNIIDDPNGVGDIIVILTNDVNPDGLSGYTRDTADGNQILKSTITIYSASHLSAAQLGAIMRHEFGHAMGLAHSTASEDLMHATIQTDYPYISQCDIDAITGLYNGDKRSQVICQN